MCDPHAVSWIRNVRFTDTSASQSTAGGGELGETHGKAVRVCFDKEWSKIWRKIQECFSESATADYWANEFETISGFEPVDLRKWAKLSILMP